MIREFLFLRKFKKIQRLQALYSLFLPCGMLILMYVRAKNQRAFLAMVNINVETISPASRTQISGRFGEKRYGKVKFFQGLPYNGPMFTKTVISLSFRVHLGPSSTQNARGECSNPKNTPCLCQEARGAFKFGLKDDFLAKKVK